VIQFIIGSTEHACSAISYKNDYVSTRDTHVLHPIVCRSGARFMLTQSSDWTESSMMIAEARANKDMEDDHWENSQ
jgi:hypothetical protein